MEGEAVLRRVAVVVPEHAAEAFTALNRADLLIPFVRRGEPAPPGQHFPGGLGHPQRTVRDGQGSAVWAHVALDDQRRPPLVPRVIPSRQGSPRRPVGLAGLGVETSKSRRALCPGIGRLGNWRCGEDVG